MAVIKHTDLFAFDDYEKALDKAESSIKEFGAVAATSIERAAAQVKQYNTLLLETKRRIDSVNLSMQGAEKQLSAYATQVEKLAMAQKEQQAVVNMLMRANQELNEQLKAQKNRYVEIKQEAERYAAQNKKAANSARDLKKEVAATTAVLDVQSREAKKAAQSVAAAEGSYKAMQQRLTALRKELREMPNAFNATTGALNRTNPEAIKLSNEIQRLDKVLKQADKSMGIFSRNVGNYQSALGGMGKGVGSIMGSIGLLVGINSGFEGLSYIVNTNKQLEALEVRMKLVSGTQEEFSRNMELSRSLANRYGIDLQVATNQLAKFTAASTAAGFSTDATRVLYEKIIKVIGNLKLNTEQTERALLAFEQMISKGKISTEELRRQLGDVLPGAFQLFAKSMGVSVGELDKMLKNGDVLAAETLPKFINELEKTYGKLDKVNSLQASTNRFFNSLQAVVKDEGITEFFTVLVDSATAFVEVFTDSGDEVVNSLVEQQAELNGLVNGLISANDQEEIRKQLITDLIAKYPTFLGQLDLEKATTDDLKSALTLVNEQYERRISNAIRAGSIERLNAERNKALNRASSATAGLQRAAFALNVDASQVDFSNAGQVQALANKLATAFDAAKQKGGLAFQTIKTQLDGVYQSLDLLDRPVNMLGLSFENFSKLAAQALEEGKRVKDLGAVVAASEEDLQKQRLAQIDQLSKRLESLTQGRQQAQKTYAGELLTNVLKNFDRDISITQQQLDQLRSESGLGNQEITMPGDTGKEAGGSTGKGKDPLAAMKERIKEQQQLEKENAEALLLIFQKQRELNLLDEEQYQRFVLKTKQDSIEKQIALEKQLGKGADKSNLAALQNDRLKAEVDYTKAMKNELERRNKEREKLEKDAEDRFNASVDRQVKKFVDAEEEKAQKRKELLKFQEDLLKIELDGVRQLEIGNLAKLGAELLYLRKRAQLYAENSQERQLIEAESAAKVKEIWGVLASELAATGAEVFNNFSEKRIMQYERERDKAIEAAGTNAAAREKIEKEYNRRITQEKRKQAIAEKAAGLFSVGINTAMAISKNNAQLGFLAAVPVNVLTLISGAMQAATILSKPIPQFKVGTKYAPEGLAIVDEEGPEMRVGPRGDVKMGSSKGANVVHLEKGTKVYTAKETARIVQEIAEQKRIGREQRLLGEAVTTMQNGRIAEMRIAASGGISKSDLEEVMERTIGNLPIEKTVWDERGVVKSLTRQNETITYLNKRKEL